MYIKLLKDVMVSIVFSLMLFFIMNIIISSKTIVITFRYMGF